MFECMYCKALIFCTHFGCVLLTNDDDIIFFTNGQISWLCGTSGLRGCLGRSMKSKCCGSILSRSREVVRSDNCCKWLPHKQLFCLFSQLIILIRKNNKGFYRKLFHVWNSLRISPSMSIEELSAISVLTTLACSWIWWEAMSLYVVYSVGSCN